MKVFIVKQNKRSRCFQWLKVTKMKGKAGLKASSISCFQWLKVTKMKEISCARFARAGCFQWLKVTKMKANHNYYSTWFGINKAVSNGSKLLK